MIFPDKLSDDDFKLRCKEWQLIGCEVKDRGEDYLIGDLHSWQVGYSTQYMWTWWVTYAQLDDGQWVQTQRKEEDGRIVRCP